MQREEKMVVEDFDQSFNEFAAIPEDVSPATATAYTQPEEPPPAATDAASFEAAPTGSLEEAVDPWDKVDLKLREQYQQALHAASSNSGRVTALNRQIADLKAQVKAPPPDSFTNGIEPDEWTRVIEEYPDLAKPIARKIEQSQVLAQQAAVNVIEQERQRERTTLEQMNLLDRMLPDWRAIASDPGFGGWINNSTPQLLAMAQSDNAVEVYHALKYYMAARPTQPQTVSPKRAAQLDSSVALDAGRRTAMTSGPPDDFAAAYDYYVNR